MLKRRNQSSLVWCCSGCVLRFVIGCDDREGDRQLVKGTDTHQHSTSERWKQETQFISGQRNMGLGDTVSRLLYSDTLG